MRGGFEATVGSAGAGKAAPHPNPLPAVAGRGSSWAGLRPARRRAFIGAHNPQLTACNLSKTPSARSSALNFGTKRFAPTFCDMLWLNAPDSELCSIT